jgi:hypothetical protein
MMIRIGDDRSAASGDGGRLTDEGNCQAIQSSDIVSALA